ncbi:glycoside hydrolase domain-containing protein [Nocardioides sp. AX2bis]|uniref:glycoside hydrolase domain-containing protein n=1 Tax=Nocardioides sp. AX2bis TaxID=2653157 RepID=UPI0012EF2332|nr:glycoside hydrolase domain-containing protein [Nocardioides sp. AX2bis]VXC31546.1 Peptidoglycan-binding protein [Nocardioides sp. AX2bis]
MPSPARPLARLLGPLAALLLSLSLVASAVPAAQAAPRPNPVTPGDLTGYGFDQCLAPTQSAMDRWLETSPFLSVGIYISGASRGCREQPNLTPSWVRAQLRKGWRLLPITLGPQASCQQSFPRYGNDPTIDPAAGSSGRYPRAREMGRTEAGRAVEAALGLGLTPGSTLWYDLEAFDVTNTACRESALSFLSTWTTRLHELGWVSGVYSSAGSGIKALDDARVDRPNAFALPDQVWIARWDGVANTSTSYLRDDGWRPGGRVKQYLGGHKETHGGVTIEIDSNFLDLGRGSVATAEERCGGVSVGFRTYPLLRRSEAGYTAPVARTKALQCLLQEKGVYDGALSGTYSGATATAVAAWRERRGITPGDEAGRTVWMSLLAAGRKPVLKVGSAGPDVRRLQRALNAASPDTALASRGVMNPATAAALRSWQGRVDLPATGIATKDDWKALVRGGA